VNKGTVRTERNMQFAIDGTTDKEDAVILTALSTVGVLA
jgi:hypothetical protein